MRWRHKCFMFRLTEASMTRVSTKWQRIRKRLKNYELTWRLFESLICRAGMLRNDEFSIHGQATRNGGVQGVEDEYSWHLPVKSVRPWSTRGCCGKQKWRGDHTRGSFGFTKPNPCVLSYGLTMCMCCLCQTIIPLGSLVTSMGWADKRSARRLGKAPPTDQTLCKNPFSGSTKRTIMMCSLRIFFEEI